MGFDSYNREYDNLYVGKIGVYEIALDSMIWYVDMCFDVNKSM